MESGNIFKAQKQILCFKIKYYKFACRLCGIKLVLTSCHFVVKKSKHNLVLSVKNHLPFTH